MPNYRNISSVTDTLVSFLNSQINPVAGELTPTVKPFDIRDDAPSDHVISIYLYDLTEDPYQRNRPVELKSSGNQSVAVKPPMQLCARYLITAWSNGPESIKNEQYFIGRVARSFYDHPVLSGNELHGDSGIKGSSEALRVSLLNLTLEDRNRIWEAVSKPLKLSLAYEVKTIRIDSTQSEGVFLVTGGQIGVGVLEPVST